MTKTKLGKGGLIALVCALVVGGGLIPFASAETKGPGNGDPAIERAKKQAKMLDTLYKTAIVLITENYVTGEESLAAGDAFQALFKTMKENGFHEVRLLDATGEPYDSDNEAKTEFEKKAIKELLAGKPIVEQIVKEGDQRYLWSATPIPVVMEKCTICHSNYEGVKGPIGSLAIKVPLD
ncbi:MAG: DUF3365 domain-containing protein [Pirellulaceae bacterium]